MSDGHITVSTVALGPEADVTLLRNLATWGGGRSYVVQDAQQIPEIFVKEARSAATPESGDSGAMKPVVRQAGAWLDATAEFPALQGYNTVTRKPQAIEWLATPRSDPLLTVWPAGLGRTAMFAADLDGRWTRDWMRWKGLGGFLGGLVRSLAPAPTAVVVAHRDGRRAAGDRTAVDGVARRARSGGTPRKTCYARAIEVRSARLNVPRWD